MKRIFLLAVLGLTLNSCSEATEIDKAKDFQKEQNKFFADSNTSPLVKDALKSFDGLDFFPIDEAYIVIGTLKRTPDEKPFEMPTTTHQKHLYVKYANVTFTLEGRTHTVELYKSLKDLKGTTSQLFLPFSDLSSGGSTYGGGRYLDLEIPEGDQITLNFNKAYNPYCAYNPKYSCPIPPDQNFIKADIQAGEKTYQYTR
ncbi:DUF1684 domain-containing protein [Myroides pelagicus]|uniref:DUF1684 domain-containing protein n=1 Tax=Myroides pelagicus TaxID=270914 RepID=A0A7K1GJI7_9FLAO|nr:DUF1684 domain-containing protein [Myroides pelagicus]MEC4113021.1 DUF1684 domain-containing protein [Myroides pelagicus]MTH28976.1 DUF1684 domain-containing protein [Myroides pelagicus]